MDSIATGSRWGRRSLMVVILLAAVLTPSLAAALDVDNYYGNSPYTMTVDLTQTTENVGTVSYGVMNQPLTGGNGGGFTNTNTVTNLNLGSTKGTGTYNLIGGTLVAHTITINPGSALYQSGGTLTASSGLINYANFSLGVGGTAQIDGSGLDNHGTLTLAGGTLQGSGSLVNNAVLTGYGIVDGSGGFTNNASFTQSGGRFVLKNTGDNKNYGNMDLAAGYDFVVATGAEFTNLGTVNLNSSTVRGTGPFTNGGVISGKGLISCPFSNAGGNLVVADGTTNISLGFSNSGLVQLSGLTANLVGGAITNTGTIQGFGNTSNPVTNTGTIEALGGTLTLGGAVTNQAKGQMFASTGNKLLVTGGLGTNAGLINLTGGTFDNNNNAMENDGRISGYGTFRSGGLTNSGRMTLSGGTTTVNGDVTNTAAGNITVAYTPAIFTGNVVNSGLVKVTNTTVTWAGNYLENGTYISDPATQNFTNLKVGATGSFTGGAGDTFIITGAFLNQSTQNASWNTTQAMLTFVGGTKHELDITGADKGTSRTGYTQNFAWGTLDLTGQILSLADGNHDPGGALYVGAILGLTRNDLQVTDIFGNGLNIYYDPNLNSKLGGLTYKLENGGLLMAATVPLPASAWLFLSGLAGLGLVGRKRKGKAG
jgi:hypothetical protein